MPFRRTPDLAFRPLHQLTQFLDLGVGDGRIVGQRQTGGIEDARLGAEVLQQARGFFDQQAAERALAGRAVQQQDAWLVRTGLVRHLRAVEQREIEVGKVV
ncbi:hypothetical protein D3C75_1047880 [compost metagenome]